MADFVSNMIASGWDVVAAIGAWIETHPGTASWAQAIGAIIAVGVAVYIPWSIANHQNSLTEGERRVKARALAFHLYPELLEIGTAIPRVTARASNSSLYASDERLAAEPHARRNMHYQIGLLKIDCSPEMLAALERIHVVDEDTAMAVSELVSVVMQHNRAMARYQKSRNGIGEKAAVTELLRHLDGLAKRAIERVGKIRDGERP